MEVGAIEEKCMVRRFQRKYVRFPVDLVSFGARHEFDSPASVIDMSQGGLRIHTGPPLIPGRLLHVFWGKERSPFAFCRVVWTQTHGGALPSESGLEILDRVAPLPGLRSALPVTAGHEVVV